MRDTNNIIELSNIEIYEHCILNINTGNMDFNKGEKQIPHYTGSYFRDEKTFFALYPTRSGPMMYYKGKEYPLKKSLHITLKKGINGGNFIYGSMGFISNIVHQNI